MFTRSSTFANFISSQMQWTTRRQKQQNSISAPLGMFQHLGHDVMTKITIVSRLAYGALYTRQKKDRGTDTETELTGRHVSTTRAT
jgi:hypothetical protein